MRKPWSRADRGPVVATRAARPVGRSAARRGGASLWTFRRLTTSWPCVSRPRSGASWQALPVADLNDDRKTYPVNPPVVSTTRGSKRPRWDDEQRGDGGGDRDV